MMSFFKRFFGVASAKSDNTEFSPVSMIRTPTVGPTIAIVNQSSVVTDDQVRNAVAALQIQITRDFAPAWNVNATLLAVPSGASAPSGTWVIFLLDSSDHAGVVGYHNLTPDGFPVAKVFCKDDITYGLSWTVTLSHELVECLADPYIVNTVFFQDSNTTGTLYALENADAVEDDSFGYLINGVLVSNFVYPAWFEGFRPANSTKFDQQGVVTAPFQLAKGGYIGTFIVGANSSGWTQKTAEAVPGRRLSRKSPYARTSRRGQALVA